MMPISQTTRNILGNADHNATISIMPSNPRASNYRASLIGSVSFYEDSQTPYGRGKEGERIRSCYLRIHNDSRIWLPPDSIPHNVCYFTFLQLNKFTYLKLYFSHFSLNSLLTIFFSLVVLEIHIVFHGFLKVFMKMFAVIVMSIIITISTIMMMRKSKIY